MIMLGIDPGLLRMGYGLIETTGSRVKLVEGGVIRGGTSSKPIADRLVALYDGVLEILKEYYPSVVVLEEIYSHYAYPNTAVQMGHGRGVVCLAAGQMGVPVVNYAATKVKNSLVGTGRASKLQIQKAVASRLQLSRIPEPNDVADALALALCHSQIAGHDYDVR